MSVVAVSCPTCLTDRGPFDGALYSSQAIRHERHAYAAWDKAVKLARAHSEETGHDVFVDQGSRRALVACRCGDCKQPTPGNATGLCGPCAIARRDKILAIVEGAGR